MWSRHVLDLSLRLTGTAGEIRVVNPLAPQIWSSISVRSGERRFRECPPRTSTYAHQLAAFCAAVLDGAAFPTNTADSVANMAVVDDVYWAAGMDPRPEPA
jgi:hypothetical protein